jgi:RNA polymerase sigma-70 factor (ECF subfamily)
MPGTVYDSQDDSIIPDEALIKQIVAGDPRALERLYQRHGLALLRYLAGQAADEDQAKEILQDVMLTVWRKAASFRGESSVRTWLISIARHRAINLRTRLPRRDDKPIDETEGLVADDPPLLESVIQASEQGQIRAALDQLPRVQRETLELVFYHALSGPEAAQVLGVAQGTVKSRLHRALATLRSLLENAKISHES